MLATQTYLFVFWTVCFVVNILGIYWIVPYGTQSPIDFPFVVVEFAAALGMEIWVGVVFRREWRRTGEREGVDEELPRYSAEDAVWGEEETGIGEKEKDFSRMS